jgi:extracellular factor (EF) 3-hydroxypalmitic acid methyl ester biosynthesis protein
MTAPHTLPRDATPLRFAPHTAPAAPAAHTAAPAHRAELAAAEALLDDVHALIEGGAIGRAIAAIVPGLRRAHDALPTDTWRDFASGYCLAHPVAGLMHQDPFIHAAFAKLRGYPGDAGILDLIYGAVPLPAGTTALGAELYAHTRLAAACDSVRFRRGMLAEAIDCAGAAAPGRARVLSVACGHLREAQCAESVRDGAIGAFYALDQDPISIALLQEQHVPLGVTPTLGSVKDVLMGRARFADLTLAYAAGLYDYLPTPVAARLTARMFDMLAPGGRLIVANFCPELRDVGMMESIMAWNLIYRDEAEMREVAAELPADRVAAQRMFRDPGGNVVYLDVERS